MVRWHFNPALTKAKLGHVRFHDLSHTCAGLLIEQRENIKYLQTQLLHSCLTVTLNVNAHLMKSVNQKAASKLESSIFETGHNLVTTDKKGVTVSTVTP